MHNKLIGSALLGAALATSIFVGGQQINAATKTNNVATTKTAKKAVKKVARKAPKLVIDKQVKGSYTLTGQITPGSNVRFYVVTDNTKKITKANAALVGRIFNIKTATFSQKFYNQNAGKTILISAVKDGKRTRKTVVLAADAPKKQATTTTKITKPALTINPIKAGSTVIEGKAVPNAVVSFYAGKDLITKKTLTKNATFKEVLYSSMLGKDVVVKVTYNKQSISKKITLKKAVKQSSKTKKLLLKKLQTLKK